MTAIIRVLKCNVELAIYPYRSQLVRDLAWCCFSERLMLVKALSAYSKTIADCHFTLTEERRRWLDQLDADPTPLLEALGGAPPKRLGLYFEALWQFFLREDAQTELIAHNLAVHDDGRTLGEFDCLYYDKEAQQAVHLELAVKYFLGFRNDSKPDEEILWYGPNSRDRLDLKLAHMLDRQIVLGEQPAAKDKLKEVGVTTLTRKIVFHGYLFNSMSSPLPYPVGHNANGQGGGWMTQGSFTNTPDNDKRYLRLAKQRWLSPAIASEDDITLSLDQLKLKMEMHFDDSSRPELIATLNDKGEEVERFFVTADGWPDVSA